MLTETTENEFYQFITPVLETETLSIKQTGYIKPMTISFYIQKESPQRIAAIIAKDEENVRFFIDKEKGTTTNGL